MSTDFDGNHQAVHRIWDSVADIEINLEPRVLHDVHVPGRLPLETLLIRKPESRKLVVYLHGPLDRSKYQLPRFERRTSLQELDANILFLTDPTLYLAPALRIGWFIGQADDNVTDHYEQLIRRVARGINAEQIIIAGASSGGYATIALAPRIPEALCIAWSPQVNVRRFGDSWAQAFRRAAFPEFETTEAMESAPSLRDRMDLAELYRNTAGKSGGRLWYVQNSGDESHVKLQSIPFESEQDDRVTFVYEHHCIGHNPPTLGRVFAWIMRALDAPDEDPQDFALPTAEPNFREHFAALE